LVSLCIEVDPSYSILEPELRGGRRLYMRFKIESL
jgi:hypothetical protein